MARNDQMNKQDDAVYEKTLRKSVEYQRIGNAATHKAQEENRRLGVPNWYSINGQIVSEAEINEKSKNRK